MELIAGELVRLRVDALHAPGALEVAAARRASTTIPIVGVDLVSDPVQLGYAASLARPGGNLTGIYLDGPGLLGKQLELLRAAVPGLQRVAVIGVDGINNAQMPLAVQNSQGRIFTLHLRARRYRPDPRPARQSRQRGPIRVGDNTAHYPSSDAQVIIPPHIPILRGILHVCRQRLRTEEQPE